MRVDPAELKRRLDAFQAAGARAGVRLTHQRLELFREVASSVDHPDAETVFRGVRKRLPSISLDTVYRTLRLFEDLGLITTLGARRQGARFDANRKTHHHFICTRCGLARDFDCPDLDTLQVPAAARELGTVLTTHVEARGLCARCARIPRSSTPRQNPNRNP